MRSTVRKGVLAGAGIIALSAVLAAPAAAEPTPPFTPDADDIVLVGSDTTMLLLNSLADAYNATNPVSRVASFDAVGASPITIRQDVAPVQPGVGGPEDVPVWEGPGAQLPIDIEVTRPNGSGSGITALKANAAIDAARSSRARVAADGGTVLFCRFARDGLDVVTDDVTNVPAGLTAAQLRQIYTGAVTNWNQLGGGNGVIAPRIPQSGSGTRVSFMSSIGVTDAQLAPTVLAVQEHDPAAVDGNPNAVAPFSEARFSTLPNPKPIQFNAGGYRIIRPLFNVVRDTNAGGEVNGGVAARLQPFFGTCVNGAPGGFLATPAAQAIITGQGFLLP